MQKNIIDPMLISNSEKITELELCTILLKNDSSYPWLILVPNLENVTELYELNTNQQMMLIKEINHISKVVSNYFNPDKINIGLLGNIVKQLHIHVIARFKDDITWPHSVWQPNQNTRCYTNEDLTKLVSNLSTVINNEIAGNQA